MFMHFVHDCAYLESNSGCPLTLLSVQTWRRACNLFDIQLDEILAISAMKQHSSNRPIWRKFSMSEIQSNDLIS